MEKRRLLIVEANPWKLAAYREAFLQANFEVLTLSGLANCRPWLHSFRPEIVVLGGETLRQEILEFRALQQENHPPIDTLFIVGYRPGDHLMDSSFFQDCEIIEREVPASLLVKKVGVFLVRKRRRLRRSRSA